MRVTCAGSAIAFLVCVLPASLAAEPVTFTYRITNLVRCEGGFSPTCQSFDQTFPLRLTIDSVPTPVGDNAVTYGEAGFSEMPLTPRISPRADGLASFTEQLFALDTDHFEVVGRAMQLYRMNRQLWSIELFGTEQFTTPFPGFSARSFAASLTQFAYDVLAPDVELQYLGAATLVDSQPVPEPAPWLLLGSGLCTLAVGRKRYRQAARGLSRP